DGEPVLAHEPADTAAEREAADAGVADDASGGGQAVCLGLMVDVAPQGATLYVGRAAVRVDSDGAHRRQVDDDPGVAHGGAGHVVASAAYGDLEVEVTGEADGRSHVRCPGASGDQSGSPVDRSVPDGSGVVVVSVFGGDQRAPEPGD